MKNTLMFPVYVLISILTWVGGLIGLMLGAFFAFITIPIWSHHTRHMLFLGPFMGFNIRCTFSRIRVIRDPGFDPERCAVFCQNHVNMLDGQLACATIPHEFGGLFNYWHTWLPGYGWIMSLAQGIRVYPKSKGGTARITEQARDRAKRGISILAFPEGHRTRTGKVGPFKRGSFFMARDAGLPVVPMCVRGMFEVNQAGSKLFKPGDITVYFGKAIETAGLTDEQIGELAERMQQIHADFVERGLTPAEREVKAA